MKNVAVILKNILAIAIIALLTIQLSGCNNDSKSNDNSSSGNGGGEKAVIKANADIAYVQVDSLISNYDMYHDLRIEFEKKAKQMDTDFTAKGRAYQKEVADYREKVEKGLVTRSQAEQIAQNLERKQISLEETGQMMRQELAEEENVMMRQISEVVINYINKYNETKGFSLILNASSLNASLNAVVLYGEPSMDITTDLIKGLNEEYIQTRVNK